MALLYICLSVCVGAGIILSLKPYWKTGMEFLNRPNRPVSPIFVFLPSAYLIGTLILSWITYFLALAFKNYEKPLFYANTISFVIAVVFLTFLFLSHRERVKRLVYETKKYGISLNIKGTEWFVLISSAVFWTFFICRSLYLDGSYLRVGVSAFSDFGAHLPVIRSFSVGKNFPAQYPHFPDGTMRYHFMFYFMAGNLEFLGLTLPQALNIPSVLSLVSFSMLLYALCVFLTKKTQAGVLSCFLFAFRSSFAFFTYRNGFSSIKDFIHAVANNLNADGTYREHIGNTLHEDWGLWAQKVYINQRHLAFAYGLFIIVLFLMIPFFVETVEYAVKSLQPAESEKSGLKNNKKPFGDYIKIILFSQQAWAVRSILPCVLSGIILGLMAYWNGAVVIAGISVLFIMAALSMHKLGYLVTAIITFALSVFQTRFFTASNTGVVSVKFNPGFLAESGSLKDIAAYYIELLGVFPFILTGVFIFHCARKSRHAAVIISVISLLLLILFMPSIGIFRAFLIILLLVLFYAALIYRSTNLKVCRISSWLIPVFAAPVVLATTLQLTPDVTVNHKYIILAVILLNIPVSDLLTEFFKSGTTFIVSVCLIFLLTCTGLVDMITLYNLDRNSVSYNLKDELLLWAMNETRPDDIFLTHYMTHYGAPMTIMLAGRSVYNGYPYFTITAGYDIAHREECMKKIYSAADENELRNLAISEGIDYIVIEDQNRNAAEYKLNEEIFYKTFGVAFQNGSITIFKVR